MTKYRSKLQIIAEILEIVRQGAKKTHIMYRANLSYKLLCKYLDEVLDCGLVHVDRGEECYVVAPKGEKFLEQFNLYMERRAHVRKELESVNEERALLEKIYINSKAAGDGRKLRFGGKGLDVG